MESDGKGRHEGGKQTIREEDMDREGRHKRGEWRDMIKVRYHIRKCHSEAHYLMQLIFVNKKGKNSQTKWSVVFWHSFPLPSPGHSSIGKDGKFFLTLYFLDSLTD
jgi:hypothetical protein